MREVALGVEPRKVQGENPRIEWAIKSLRKIEINSRLKDKSAAGSAPTLGGTRGVTSGPVTVFDNDTSLFVDATAGAITVNLPKAAESNGRILNIKKIDASGNAVTIDGDGAETIDGAATAVIALQWVCITVQSDGTQWFII